MRLANRTVRRRDRELLQRFVLQQDGRAMRKLLHRWLDDPRPGRCELARWPLDRQLERLGQVVRALMDRDEEFYRVAAELAGQPGAVSPDYHAEKRRRAIHEAGHTVLARELGVAFSHVTVLGDLDQAGHVEFAFTLHERVGDIARFSEPAARREAAKDIQVVMAGELAVELLEGAAAAAEGADDDRMWWGGLVEILCAFDPETTMAAYTDTARAETRAILSSRRDALERIAGALQTRGRLTADDVEQLWSVTEAMRFHIQYTNKSADVIVADLVSRFAPGLTTNNVQGGLPTVSAISFMWTPVNDAIHQVAKWVGAQTYWDYFKDLHFFVGTERDADPTDLTAAHPTLTDFAWDDGLSQVVTRWFGQGGGSTASAAVAVGATTVPVTDVSPFQSTGGTVVVGAQRVTYTGIQANNTTVTGSTTIAARPAPSAAPSAVNSGSAASFTPGNYTFKQAFLYSDGTESLPSAASSVWAAAGNVWPSMTLQTGDARVTGRRIYYSLNGGSYLHWNDVNDNSSTVITVTIFGQGYTPQAFAASYPAGSTYIYVSDVSLFAAGGGSATSGSNTFTYTGRSASSGVGALTGIPASGAGSVAVNINVNDTIKVVYAIGTTTLPIADTSSFSSTGGTARSGSQTFTYTGRSTTSGAGNLTGIPASGAGALTASITAGDTIFSSSGGPGTLTGIPASGVGSVLYAINQGDAVNLLVQVDDAAAQATLGALLGSYAQIVLKDAPVGYWRMDAASGTTEIDRSTGGHNGTITGGVTLNQAGALSDGDTAELFNGSTGYVDAGTSASLGFAAAFSAEAWFKTTSAARQWIAGREDSSTGWGWNLGLYDNGAIWFALNTNAGATTLFNVVTTNQYKDGAWHHVVATWDGTTNASEIKIFVDGVLIQSFTALANTPTDAPPRAFRIGADDSSGSHIYYFNGAIDEVAVYSSALSAQQIANHYYARLSTLDINAGIQEDFINCGNVTYAETLARVTAQLTLRKNPEVKIRYKCRDPLTRKGRTIKVNLPAPQSAANGSYKIQQVTISQFLPANSTLYPIYDVQASSTRFSLEDLLRIARKAVA